MLKYTVLFAVAGMLALGAPSKSTFNGGSWQVDANHSDARLITDATTDYGKTKDRCNPRLRQGKRSSRTGQRRPRQVLFRFQDLSGYLYVARY